MESKIIAVCNQKGGVAKTFTSINLGIGLSRAGKKVLLVDMDAQGSLTASLGWQQPDQMDVTLATLMSHIINDEPVQPGEGILHHKEEVDVVPANIELSGIEVALVNIMSRETVLREYLKTVRDNYDYIILDCGPSLGMLTINAMSAADSILIPMQAQFLSIKGMEQLLRTISKIKRKINSHLEITGILITMADLRTNFSREIDTATTEIYTLSLHDALPILSLCLSEL